VGATFVTGVPHHLGLILVGLALGAGLGWWGARVVQMTDMPQMVALLNGLGGGAAAAVSAAEFAAWRAAAESGEPVRIGSILAGTLIGAVSFSGSLLAFAKLQGIGERALVLPGGRLLQAAVVVGALVTGTLAATTGSLPIFLAFVLLSLALGVLMVVPIGGADMPVVISILNSCTGLAAAAAGLVLDNHALLVSGTLVGASGTLLTRLMCKAMNRSLANVLFGALGAAPAPGAVAGDGKPRRPVRDVSVEDAAVLLANVQSLIIVPGYGLAVAQAQHTLRQLVDVLLDRGTKVDYAIHPVAGRMPGHMNVLLAEAQVPYEQLKEMDEINGEFKDADVVLVVGANDVVNPAAKTSPGAPIYGMPILNADEAKAVVFMKRSMRPGFAGIENELLFEPNTTLLFGDAKDSMGKLLSAVKAL